MSAVLAGFGLMAAGCDGGAADSQAISQMEKGDFKAAATQKEASPAITALAAGRAADEQHAKALPTYRDIAINQIQISDATWYMARLATTASQVQASAGYLANYNPQQALDTLDKTVASLKGDGQQAWSPANIEVQMPTITALTSRSNQLKDQITELENNLNGLRQQQQTLMQQSEKFLADSGAAKGEQSLQLFKQAADTRKQATQVSVQVAQAEAALVPLQQELAVVEDQVKLAGESVNVMSGHRENIEKSWRGITAQADQRANYVAAIFARGTPERPGTIAAQATRLSELISEQGKLASSYEQQLQDAATLAKQAVSSSEAAIKEAQQAKWSGSKAGNPNDLTKLAMDPSTARFTQAHIEFSLGTHKAGQAAILSTRARVLQDVAQVATQLKQQLPETLDAAATKTEADQAAAQADESLKSAEALFGTATEAPAAPPYTKRSSGIGQMATLHASALLADTRGDAATAKQYLDQAKAIRDRLMESGEALPSLPVSLQGPATAAPAGAGAVEQ